MFFLLGKARETTTLVISFRHYCFWEMWGTWGKAVFTTLPRRLWSELAADTVPPSTDLGLFISCLLLFPVLGEQRLQGMQIKPGFDPMTSPKISLGWRILSEKEELAFGPRESTYWKQHSQSDLPVICGFPLFMDPWALLACVKFKFHKCCALAWIIKRPGGSTVWLKVSLLSWRLF